ncbi:MAG TPA: RNase adapter RapZ [Candidatus Nanopelagicaceae bacterium]|nr:RNase adapter RapZ [Candidatus Nanopelagicaceae bacterium]
MDSPWTDSTDQISGPQIIVVTGMSGAGRSTCSRVLEDLGWYVVDNLPPTLLGELAALAERAGSGGPTRIAVVIDVRGRAFFKELRSSLDELKATGISCQIAFLEADDNELVRRFESTRRPHPLQGDGRILDGIESERALLHDLRGESDVLIDTTGLNVHQLKEKVERIFGGAEVKHLRVTVLSFGFKYGLPYDSDFLIDARFIPNPHWIPELQPKTGLDEIVSNYVLAADGVVEFIDGYAKIFSRLAPSYEREGKKYLTLSVGCTGGKHRSVAVAENLAERLCAEGIDAIAVHRDVGKE